MKRIFILMLLVILPVVACYSQDITYNSSPTLQWNYPDVDENGDPWLPEDIISFDVYLWNTADGDITLQPLANLNYFSSTTNHEMVLNFTNRYNWAVAVRARVTDGAGNTRESGVAYSTVMEDTDNNPFVYVPTWEALPLQKVTGLRDSGM
jgi:hypothetical protein